MSATTLLLVLDLVGIAVFGVSGALAGVDKNLDLFGVLFLSVATALGGGFMRDALIGSTPAAALTDGRYLLVPVVVGLIVFYVHPAMARLSRIFLLVDAAGLGLFAVAGARKALDFGVPAVGACGIGLLTAIGGGIIRDVLVREIPAVLHREIYATAALLATVIVVIGDKSDFNNVATAAVAIAAAFGLRVISRWKQWSAPLPRTAE
ncbi:unannotated protein [freshwater metagenome]|uniref:Unannotated protein n=1 Tax=freshwater metagenome TaxID=449393 RepID=A0A6J6HVG2_9ZZZZ|nr:trimeric intracellular cation channel family protein [Actinomycetota bacterium]